MIYTTYFSNLKKLPKNIVPVSIARLSPVGFNGIQYKKLAPRFETLKILKDNDDVEKYTDSYINDVISDLDVHSVVSDLYSISGVGRVAGKDSVALVCYEKPNDFCHRQIVARWFEENGYEVKEYK